tara:strand:+ start:133 stop:912 length:780 start_codon:yes stop_codon:yes gene_type:complete
MPRYKNKVGKIIELPKLSGKEARALGLRSVITVKDIEDAGKRKKQVGGIINRQGIAVRGGTSRDAKRKPKTKKEGFKPAFVGRRSKELRKKDVKGKVLGAGKAIIKDETKAMKIGGLTGNIQLKRDESDFTVRERSRRNLNKKFQEKKNKLREKYKDRGTAGAKQYRKESSESEKKSQKKYNVDRSMVEKYGKDAYKSRAFGVSPEEPKRKTKPKSVNKPKVKTNKPRFLHGVEAKIGRMRGGGIARSGSASLSGYKVR